MARRLTRSRCHGQRRLGDPPLIKKEFSRDDALPEFWVVVNNDQRHVVLSRHVRHRVTDEERPLRI